MNQLPKIVITGSEGLIGKALSEYLSERYQIFRLDLRLGHDLNDEKFVAKWFAEHQDDLYALIICHAFNPTPNNDATKIEPADVALTEIKAYLENNVVSPFLVIREFIKNNKSGRIITLSSIYGQVSPRHDLYSNYVKPLGYSMTKGAIALMTKYLASYYAPNYLINTVVLGGIAEDKINPDFRKKYEANVPAKRMMRVEETFTIFDFLLDQRNTYTTGAEIVSDGGWTAW